MARASRFDLRRKALKRYAEYKRTGKGLGSSNKKGMFKKELKKGLMKWLPKMKAGSDRKLEKSKMSPEEKFKLILEASRK